MTIDPRIPTMPGRSTSGFHQPGRHFLHHARSAVRGSIKGEAGGGGASAVDLNMHALDKIDACHDRDIKVYRFLAKMLSE